MKASSNGSSAASKSMANIDDDLLTEILIRLPDSRHAVRLAAVCKRWSSLISDSQFIRSFVDRRLNFDSDSDSDSSAGPLALLFQRHHYEYEKLPIIDSKYYQILFDEKLSTTNSYLSFLPYDDVVIRAYSDDLLLVSRANADYAGSFSFCICNPMTKKWCELPEPPRGIVRLVKCALVCRRSNQDQGRYCYNVALFFYMTKGYLMPRVNTAPEKVWSTVFSLETERWSPLATISPSPLMKRWQRIIGQPWICIEPVPCSNGVVHWSVGESAYWRWIVAFDPFAAAADGNRECGLVSLPAEVGEEPDICRVRLGSYKGRLRAVLLSHNIVDKVLVLRVWERNDNSATSCWSFVHNAALEMEVERCAFPLAFHPSNRNVVFLLIDFFHACRYDMSRRKGEMVGLLQELTRASRQLTVYALWSPWPTPVPSLQST